MGGSSYDVLVGFHAIEFCSCNGASTGPSCFCIGMNFCCFCCVGALIVYFFSAGASSSNDIYLIMVHVGCVQPLS